jgi:uncharacterized DUF497 family protein
MEIEFDPTKDEANQTKHGMSLELANAIDLDLAAISPDDRRAYGRAPLSCLGIDRGAVAHAGVHHARHQGACHCGKQTRRR